MSDNKDISSSIADNNKTLLLPKDVQDILQKGMAEGFYDGYLNLGTK